MHYPNDHDPYLVLAALTFLLVQFAQQRRAGIADAIADHFARLEAMADHLPAVIAKALPRLRSQWCTFQLQSHLTAYRRRTPGVVVPFPTHAVRP